MHAIGQEARSLLEQRNYIKEHDRQANKAADREMVQRDAQIAQNIAEHQR